MTHFDSSNYDREDLPNGDVLFKKKATIISEISMLDNYDFSKSSILSGTLDGKDVDRKNYSAVSYDIYKKLDVKKLKLTTTIKIVDGKKSDGRFRPLSIGISVRGGGVNKGIRDIMTQCVIYDIPLNLLIKLENGKKVNVINIIGEI